MELMTGSWKKTTKKEVGKEKQDQQKLREEKTGGGGGKEKKSEEGRKEGMQNGEKRMKEKVLGLGVSSRSNFADNPAVAEQGSKD